MKKVKLRLEISFVIQELLEDITTKETIKEKKGNQIHNGLLDKNVG
jgi:hypothetical protein